MYSNGMTPKNVAFTNKFATAMAANDSLSSSWNWTTMATALDLIKRFSWVASGCAIFSAVLLSVHYFGVKDSQHPSGAAYQTAPERSSLSMLNYNSR